MGLRFRKSISLGKGVKLNINKNSIGLSAGTKGARVSINSKGRKTTTIDIPGTGISYVSTKNTKKHNCSSNTSFLSSEVEFTEEDVLKRHKEYKRISKYLFIIAILLFIAAFPLGAFVFLLSVIFLIVGILSNLMGSFIKWQGLKILKNK